MASITVVPPFVVPGIGAASAYASGDAMGERFRVPVACEFGCIQTVTVVDMDKEQIPFDIVLFTRPFTATADNSAFDMADGDAFHCIGHIPVFATDYIAFNDNAMATLFNVGFLFHAPTQELYAQLVTRGAPNYTAASDLRIGFGIETREVA